MITGAQIRMARAALKWRVNDLAERTGLTWARIQQMERADDKPNASDESLEKIVAVMTKAGIVFIDADGDLGPGVRLARSSAGS